MNLTKITIGLSMLILILITGCQTTASDRSIIITDYDVNGNIINQKMIPLSMNNPSTIQALSIPEEFKDNYIYRELPNMPNNTAIRNLQVIITNSGNIVTEIEILNATFQGVYTS